MLSCYCTLAEMLTLKRVNICHCETMHTKCYVVFFNETNSAGFQAIREVVIEVMFKNAQHIFQHFDLVTAFYIPVFSLLLSVHAGFIDGHIIKPFEIPATNDNLFCDRACTYSYCQQTKHVVVEPNPSLSSQTIVGLTQRLTKESN